MSKNLYILGSDNFKKEIASGVTVVDFYADWCGPCKMLAPAVSKLADEFEGKAKIAKLNVDQASDIAAEYNVMSIPTVIAFKDGKPVDKSVGLTSKDELSKMIHKIL